MSHEKAFISLKVELRKLIQDVLSDQRMTKNQQSIMLRYLRKWIWEVREDEKESMDSKTR